METKRMAAMGIGMAMAGVCVLMLSPMATAEAVTVEQVNQAFRLNASTIIDLDVDATPGRAQSVAVAIDGKVYTLALTPHSVRSPRYRLRAQVADGSYVELQPTPDGSVRGWLVEAPGSAVAGGLTENGLHLAIHLPDDVGEARRIWIEPLAGRIPGAQPTQHVMYRAEDVIHPDGTCGVDEDFLQAFPPLTARASKGGSDGGAESAGVACTQVGVDADFEFFTAYGSTVANVQNRIDLIFSTMNLQFLSDVDIQHEISHLIVRTAEPDPYDAADANGLLGQLQNHWTTAQAEVPRDIVHLFTGRDIEGSIIGIAYLNAICSPSFGYGLVQSDCCGSLACTTDLSAHELGHNWGANHCSCSNPAYTMNPFITCINRFAPVSIAEITNFRSICECLSTCPDAGVPFTENFPATAFNPVKWAAVNGAVIDTVGINEPSPPNSLRLRGNSTTGGNYVQTARIDTTPLGILTFDYYYQRRGGGDQPEAGDDLIVQYLNSVGNWVEISRQLGAGPAMSDFALASHSLPLDARHAEFRLRFRVSSTQNNLDDWFVDDINVGGVFAPTNDDCTNTIVKGAGSHPFTTLGAATDGPDEPGACSSNGFTQIDKDIWYKFLAQCNGTATVSLCGATFNAKLAAYPNFCPSLSGLALACNDDFCGDSPQISFPVSANSVYRLRIGGVNGASGNGTMVITCTPDLPPFCTGDITFDGVVDVNDLLAVINNWGFCFDCPEDINGDHFVNVNDLLALINAWGPCP